MMALLRHQTVYLAIFVNPDKTFQVCPASFQHEIFIQHQRLLPCNQVGPSSPWLRLHQGPFPWLYCVESRKSMHNFRFFDPTFGVFLGFKFLGFPMRRRMNETTVARIINPWTILCKHVSIFDLQYIWNTVCYNYFNYILQWHEQIWNNKKNWSSKNTWKLSQQKILPILNNFKIFKAPEHPTWVRQPWCARHLSDHLPAPRCQFAWWCNFHVMEIPSLKINIAFPWKSM